MQLHQYLMFLGDDVALIYNEFLLHIQLFYVRTHLFDFTYIIQNSRYQDIKTTIIMKNQYKIYGFHPLRRRKLEIAISIYLKQKN